MSALIGQGGVVKLPHSVHGARHAPRGASASQGGAA